MGIHFIEEGISFLKEHTPVDEASIRIVVCSLLSYPFAVIFKRLPDVNYTLKNFYVVFVSSFYVFGILNLYSGIQTLLISALGCYFITRYVRTSAMPWLNFVFLMSHLCVSHLHTQFFVEMDSSKIDITGAHMVLIIKLTSFGWNVFDGRRPKDQLTEFNKSRVIRRHPNILPYLGYVFFFASVLTGPSFDYADYDKFIHSTMFDDVPDSKRPGRIVKRKIPKSGWQAFGKFSLGIFFATLLILLGERITLAYVFDPQFVEYHSFFYRIFYLWALGFVHRLKYYTIWEVAEGSCILCGIGYNGYDSETNSFRWNRVQNIDPWSFETGQNVHACLESWNMNTNKWLKNYVYLRVAKKGKRPGFKSTLFTFVTSAFWHGTRPGYYMTFVMGAFYQTIGRIYRRNFRPMFLKSDGTGKSTKIIYDIISYFVTQLAFGYAVHPFVILDFKKSLQCWSTVYYYGAILSGLTMVIFKGPYSKVVTNWCKQFHPPAVEAKEEKIDKVDESKYQLNSNEKQKIKEVLVNSIPSESLNSSDEIPTLGLPPIDVLEDMNKEEFDQDMKELAGVWNSFRSRRKSLNDDDFEGLKDAYNSFKEEINDIFASQSDSLKNELNKMKDCKKKE